MASKSLNPGVGEHSQSGKSWPLRVAMIALGVLAIAFLLGRLSGLRGTPAPEPQIVPAVHVEIAVPRPLEIYQTYTGTITARERFQVASQINATVLAVPKREGDRVLAGDILARLDTAEFRAEVGRQQANVERLEADLVYWEAQLRRNQKMYAVSAVSEQALDDNQRQVRTLQAAVKEAREALAQAETRLGYTEICAPSDGFVQTVHALPGDLATVGAPLIELLDDRDLKVTVTLPQGDLAILSAGVPALVEIDALGYRENANLHRLYPALDTRTRTATGEVFLAETPAGVRPGMLASVSLQLHRVDAAITVPIHAIHYRSGAPGVFVDNDGTAEWRAVETGYAAGDRVHIVDGVIAGSAVIVTPDSRLTDGVAIKRVADLGAV